MKIFFLIPIFLYFFELFLEKRNKNKELEKEYEKINTTKTDNKFFIVIFITLFMFLLLPFLLPLENIAKIDIFSNIINKMSNIFLNIKIYPLSYGQKLYFAYSWVVSFVFFISLFVIIPCLNKFYQEHFKEQEILEKYKNIFSLNYFIRKVIVMLIMLSIAFLVFCNNFTGNLFDFSQEKQWLIYSNLGNFSLVIFSQIAPLFILFIVMQGFLYLYYALKIKINQIKGEKNE